MKTLRTARSPVNTPCAPKHRHLQFSAMVAFGVGIALTMAAIIRPASALELHSSDFADNGPLADAQVFNGFGCKGGNLSPALSWSDVPDGTKSFALMVHDPDAPTGSGWWHWVVTDIPADRRSLPQNAGDATNPNAIPGAHQLKTDFGLPGYGGPCPPVGDAPHPYQFTLFALDVAALEMDANASTALVGFMVHAHTIARTTLTGTYGRPDK
ncbi:YbhB/YbcL family Raf kinase inhibitor-like protein [Thalassospira sp.]|uniref:YbhB/YbcL family Raf kinase inhibitor-like protein n=1 Tax=Thalassospira sp. TaxID=1912094 RepID=UPI003AA9C048